MLQTIIKSQTNPDKEYRVFLTEKGWKCNCPGFLFRAKVTDICKHIREAYQKLEKKIKN